MKLIDILSNPHRPSVDRLNFSWKSWSMNFNIEFWSTLGQREMKRNRSSSQTEITHSPSKRVKEEDDEVMDTERIAPNGPLGWLGELVKDILYHVLSLVDSPLALWVSISLCPVINSKVFDEDLHYLERHNSGTESADLELKRQIGFPKLHGNRERTTYMLIQEDRRQIVTENGVHWIGRYLISLESVQHCIALGTDQEKQRHSVQVDRANGRFIESSGADKIFFWDTVWSGKFSILRVMTKIAS